MSMNEFVIWGLTSEGTAFHTYPPRGLIPA